MNPFKKLVLFSTASAFALFAGCAKEEKKESAPAESKGEPSNAGEDPKGDTPTAQPAKEAEPAKEEETAAKEEADPAKEEAAPAKEGAAPAKEEAKSEHPEGEHPKAAPAKKPTKKPAKKSEHPSDHPK